MNDFLKEIQVAGLFHDIGKFIHKTSTSKYNQKLSHQELSKMFIKENKSFFNLYNMDLLEKLVLHHHDNKKDDVRDDFSNEEKILLNILKLSDGFSASNDRRSENNNNSKNGRAEYAPIFSITSQIVKKDEPDDAYDRYAVVIPQTNDFKYQVRKFIFDNDTKDTMLKFDPYHISKLDNLFGSFCKDIEKTDGNNFNQVDDLLEQYLIYINPNTWHIENSKIGNTTTSLYDHCKTTSAIAGCCYRHYLKTKEMPSRNKSNITFFHIYLNDDCNIANVISLREIIIDSLESIGLYKTSIIGSMENELYFLYPNSDVDDLIGLINEYNYDWFDTYGITINYEFIKDWNFSKNFEFKKEMENNSKKFIGIKEILKDEKNLKPNIQNLEYVSSDFSKKRFKNSYILGFKVNNYEDFENALLNENDSISKLTTFLRTYESFYKELFILLKNYNIETIKTTFNSMYLSCSSNELLKIIDEINTTYNRYFGDITGLTFSYMEYKRYVNYIDILENDIEKLYKRKLQQNINNKYHSFFRFGNLIIPLTKTRLLELQKEINDIYSFSNNSLKYKVLEIYESIINGLENKDISCLVYVSKLNYLATKAKDKDELDFLTNYYKILRNESKDIDLKEIKILKIKEKYEILKLSLTRKGV